MDSLLKLSKLLAMSEESAEISKKSPRGSARGAAVVWAFFLGLTFFTVVGFSCFYYFVAKPMKDTAIAPAQRLASAMTDIFGTKVDVKGSSVVLEKSEIGELALVQRKTQAITKYETSWMGSKKILIVRCDFIVKAGFDLSEGGQWDILEKGFVGTLPRAKILSVEPLGGFEIYFSENGTLNKLDSTDHAKAFNFLKDQARRDAEDSDIVKEAEDVLLRRITDKVGDSYLSLDVLP